MNDRARFNRSRFLRAELLTLVILLGIWAYRTDSTLVSDAKAAILQQVVKVVPTDGVLRYLGQHHHDAAQLDQAADAYQLLAFREPDSIEAYIGLSNCYRGLNKYAEAVGILKKLVNAYPDYTFGYISLASNYMDMNCIKEAIEAYKKAIELEPNMANLYVHLGRAYLRIGNVEEAIKACRQAIDINPKLSEAHFELAKAYISAGKPELAKRHYQILTKLNDSQAEQIRRLGRFKD